MKRCSACAEFRKASVTTGPDGTASQPADEAIGSGIIGATGQSLFAGLQDAHPGEFTDGQVRTLQRRVRQWRHILAKQLIYNTPAT